MKKLLLMLSFLLFTFSSFAEEKILIAYFSRFGNTNYSENTDATASASIILNGLAVEAGDVNNAQRQTAQWLNSISIEKK